MKKPEDTSAGCRTLAHNDQARAAHAGSDHMSKTLQRSAEAWTARADMLERLEANFKGRAASARQSRQARVEWKADG